MLFRTIHATKGSCAICSLPTARLCQNCNVSHCTEHMLEASCAGCTATLWGIARRQLNQVKLASYVGGGMAMVLAVAFTPFSTLPLVALGIYATVGGLVPKAASALVGRKLAKRQLPQSSRRLQLPSASEVAAPIAPRRESEYDARRRRNKARGRRGSTGGGVRAVFMTRGGHFYQ